MRFLLLSISAFAFLKFLHVEAQDDDEGFVYPAFCPDLKLQDNFDSNRTLGLWYEKAHSENLFCKCSSHNLHYDKETNKLKSTSRVQFYDGEIDVLDFFLKFERHDHPNGHCVVLYDKCKSLRQIRMYILDPQNMHFEVFYLLETDYDNYAIKYGCYDLGGTKFEYVWIIMRDKDAIVTEELIEKTKEHIRMNNIDVKLSNIIEPCDEFNAGHV